MAQGWIREEEISWRPQAVWLCWAAGMVHLEALQRLHRACVVTLVLLFLVTHTGRTGAGMGMCLCLYLLLLLSVELGLGRGAARHSLPDLSTYRYYLWRGDDGMHILSIVLLPSAAQQTWLPRETSIYFKKKNSSYSYRHLSELISISVKDR